MEKDLLTIKDLAKEEVLELLELAGAVKREPHKYQYALKGKALGLVFQKPSARTRVSFEVGMRQLGGYAVYLAPEDIRLGEREEIRDLARTFSRYLDVLAARTFSHKDVEELAKYADISVINALSDFSHPCQALSDIFTIKEKKGSFENMTLAYIGDGNNVLTSLIFACSRVGLKLKIGVPKGYEPADEVLAEGGAVEVFHNSHEAVKGADVIYTDVWTSMGCEDETQKRKEDFKEFQVNGDLVAAANKGALIMHCLPAHRGEEISAEVFESENSIVFDQAENRMHLQKAVLVKLAG